MSRRSMLIIAVVSIVVLTLSACGKDAPSEVATAPPTAAPTKPAAGPLATASAPAPQPQPTAPRPATRPAATRAPVVQTQPTAPPAAVPAPITQPSPIVRLNGGPPTAEPAVRRSGQADLPTVEVVKILTPSVVQILTKIISMGMFNQATPGEGVGTGVILDTDGRILTNNHVVEGAQEIIVTLFNGESFPARIVGTDPNTDLAVIQISAPNLAPARLGNSSELEVGEDVIATGHALGLQGGPTVSKGVVSALGRSIDTDARTTIVDLIQTDASINPGNSGGPLANARGEVIGINSAGIPSSQGIGFAINIDDAKVVVAQLIERGFVSRGFLGISPFNLDPGIANQMGLPVTQGIIVAQVFPGTAAEAAGLQVGDVIVQLGNEAITNTGELGKFLLAHPAGDTVDIVIVRGTQRMSSNLTLGQR